MVDESINFANDHIREREENGESASHTLSSVSRSQSVQEKRYSDVQEANKSFLPIQEEQKRQENELGRQYAELNERFVRFEQEQGQKEGELQQQAAELELTKQQAEEARTITELNLARADTANQGIDSHRTDPPLPSLQSVHHPNGPFESTLARETTQRMATVKLKGVDLPNFSGEDKTDYESWKAAFVSIVDEADIPVSEKCYALKTAYLEKHERWSKTLVTR